jgi:hypothetical protein
MSVEGADLLPTLLRGPAMKHPTCHPNCPKCGAAATAHQYSTPIGEYGIQYVRCGRCSAVIGVVISEALKRASERKIQIARAATAA